MFVNILLLFSACPRVGSDLAQPASDPTKSDGQTFNLLPTERMIDLDGLEHQRAAIGFGQSRDLEIRGNPTRKL